ncbi:MAG: ATP citrate synthase, partial [Anaerolineae bacterium]|nr:ATP citrate synthase [Anaerolineae bacterium]
MVRPSYQLFDQNTTAIVYNLQANAVQRMLDFDHLCRRLTPSVAAIVNPTGQNGYHKAYFGSHEMLIPVYRSLADAAASHPDADVMVNFASFRSAFESTMAALETPTIRTVAVIAEGVPERQARTMAAKARQMRKGDGPAVIIGPATVGGLAAGAFKIGNTGGTPDNIIEAKLHRPGSVGYVGKSGGLTNETFNILARNADGVYEGIAIGGDAYPGSRLIDHLLRY